MRRAVASAFIASTALTVAVASISALHFAYRRPALHTALETAASLVLVLATFLVIGRLRRRRRLNELLLALALAVLAFSSVLFALLPALGGEASQELVWSGRVDSAAGAALLAAAAFVPARVLKRPRRAEAVGLAGVLALGAVTMTVLSVIGGRLPGGVEVAEASRSTTFPDLHADSGILVLHVIAALAFFVAALGFMRGAERRGDELLAWLAVAAVLAAFSRVNYFLYPTRYTDWVYTGDGFRLVSYTVLLAGAMREISLYWRSVTEAAVLEERRRIARELHDGLAQELSYLGRNLRAFAPLDEHQAEGLERLQHSVERAQLESRRALAALSAPANEPVEIALGRAAVETADRFGAALELELAHGIRLSPLRMESLVRIASEAVANAARHSGTQEISLSLERADGGVLLRVRDRGCGFDTAARTSGFGLTSMRERARAVGGRFAIESSPGHGTVVEVAL